MNRIGRSAFVFSLAIFSCVASAQNRVPAIAPQPVQGVDSAPRLVEGELTAAGSAPFHLKATITEKDSSGASEVDIAWLDPSHWRRTISSDDFSQTLIVNGKDIFEKNSSDYFPLPLRVLVTAMADANSALRFWRPGDTVFTKANGLSRESGAVCPSPSAKNCFAYPWGLTEFVAAPGHSIWFTDYRKFKGKRIARQLVYRVDPGDSFTAKITNLDPLGHPSADLLSIPDATPPQGRLQTIDLPQAQLQALALQPLDIIWPQVIDGKTSGDTSYYVSIDRSGTVREALPVSVAVERADDSARRQISRWKFKPVLKEGAPVQVEGLLNFHFDTRAYGPAAPLTDSEVRKLATKIVEPDYPPGTPSGTTCSVRIAVDSDGYGIEVMEGPCPRELAAPCLHAIQQWQFTPVLENGQPRPYRGEITFRVP